MKTRDADRFFSNLRAKRSVIWYVMFALLNLCVSVISDLFMGDGISNVV